MIVTVDGTPGPDGGAGRDAAQARAARRDRGAGRRRSGLTSGPARAPGRVERWYLRPRDARPAIPGDQPVAADPAARTVRWYLESLVEGGRQLRRIGVLPAALPGRTPPRARALALVRLGLEGARRARGPRRRACACATSAARTARSSTASGSSETPLREGDIVHFAQVEFRVGRQEIEAAQDELLEPSTVVARRRAAAGAVRGGRARAAGAAGGAPGARSCSSRS